MRRSLTLLLLLAACMAGAQVRLEFEGKGDRQTAFRAPGSPGDLTGLRAFEDASIEVAAPSDLRLILVVIDRRTGLAAERPWQELAKSKTWKPGPKDFTRLAELQVAVQGPAGPVETASVSLEAAGDKRAGLIGPSDQGIAFFRNLPNKPVSVQATYKSGGESKTTLRQTVTVAVEPGKPVVISLMAPGAGGTPKPPETTQAPAEKPAPARSPWSTLFGLALGLAVIGGAVYGFYRWYQAKPDQAKDLLKQAGLQPSDPDPDPPAQVPSAPAPLQKIVLDPAASPVAPAAVAPLAANPRLVAADGSVFLLADGISQIGREAGRQVALVTETTVSRLHAEVELTGGTATIRDAGSSNGTFVNGQKVDGSRELVPGDVVQLGSVVLRYES